MRILITAGATRNKVDAIRYLSAHATGRTGSILAYRLARSMAEEGGVDVLGSAEALFNFSHAIYFNREEFFGTRDLMARVERLAPLADIIIHSAAVGDYEVDAIDGKILSGQPEVMLRLTPAPKILDHIRAWSPNCFLVSFKAAAPGTTLDDLEAIARAQLLRTRSDIVFANVIGNQEKVILVRAKSATRFKKRSSAIETLLDQIEQLPKKEKAVTRA